MTNIDKAAAEITARTAEIKAGMESRGNLADQLRKSLAANRQPIHLSASASQTACGLATGSEINLGVLTVNPSEVTCPACQPAEARAAAQPAEGAETREPVQINLADLPQDAREEIEDAEEDIRMSQDRFESAADDLRAARVAFEQAQLNLDVAHETMTEAGAKADAAQRGMSDTLRAYGLVITASGYARRPM